MTRYTATFRLESEFEFDPYYVDTLLADIAQFIDKQTSSAVTVTVETGRIQDV